jgi:hypothetical protein
MTRQDAKETTIYLVKSEGTYTPRYIRERRIGSDYKPHTWFVDTENLFDFIASFAEQGTNPDGAGNKMFIREKDEQFELRYWQIGGRAKVIETFATEEEAEEEWFRRTYEYDFLQSNEDNMYYSTEEEAEADIFETIADQLYINMPVAASIYKKMKAVRAARLIREAAEKKQIAEFQAAESERIEKLATIYADMVENVPGESPEDTARRLGEAINHERIEKRVFWKAIKMIRNK